jgi:hypothetical protein
MVKVTPEALANFSSHASNIWKKHRIYQNQELMAETAPKALAKLYRSPPTPAVIATPNIMKVLRYGSAAADIIK